MADNEINYTLSLVKELKQMKLSVQANNKLLAIESSLERIIYTGSKQRSDK